MTSSSSSSTLPNSLPILDQVPVLREWLRRRSYKHSSDDSRTSLAIYDVVTHPDTMEDLQLFVNSIVDLFRVEYRLRPTDQVMALLKSDGVKVFRVPLQSLEHVTSASIS